MPNIQTLDPSASPLNYFGSELRRVREALGLKQAQLGAMLYCTGSLIGQIETTKKVPTREFAEALDQALRTDGLFSRLVSLVLRSQLPSWLLPFEAGEHASLDGSFTTMRFDDDPDIIYTEDLISGHMTANPDTIREASLRYSHLQATALSVEKSVARISRVMEERYGDRP